MYLFYPSSKFWKKFDSFGMTFYKEFFVKGSERATREITRTILKYIHDKNFSNKTSVNHINDIWENIHQENEQFDVNGFLQKTINLVLPSHQYDYRQKQKVHINGTQRYCFLIKKSSNKRFRNENLVKEETL